MSKAFAKNQVEKQYLAFVWGHVNENCLAKNDWVKLIEPFTYSIKMGIGRLTYTLPSGVIKRFYCPSAHPNCTVIIFFMHML